MPYITTDHVARIRKEIKTAFPDFKFSIRREHHSSVRITILSAPIQLLVGLRDIRTNEIEYPQRGYTTVNHFYVKEHYKDHPEVRDVLLKIVDIMMKENKEESYDSDYGYIPEYYCHLQIGEWNKPFEVK